jgi:C_GCAxxG_C_C family probable redox protein
LDPVEAAEARFRGSFNCAQSVLSALAPQLGLPEETALKVGAAFGNGIGRTGNVCGAVTGALMAIGLRYGTTDGDDKAAKEKTYTVADEFMARFRDLHQYVGCSDLLGRDMGTPEGRDSARALGLYQSVCMGLVHDAVVIARDLLG